VLRTLLPDTLLIMSTAESWDLTVPEDEAELLAELRRHGVRPGQHLHVLETGDDESAESIRRAFAAIRAVIDTGLGDKLKAVMADVKLPAPVLPPDLTQAQREALVGLINALDEAATASRGPVEDAAPTRPRRRLRFTGMISAEPDLSENFDRYLAQSYERD
jgi:hypothetical protein